MYYALQLFLPVKTARNVHDAAGIGDHQRGRLRFLQIVYLALEELGGELGMCYRENPTKTAAILGLGKFHDLGALHAGEQCARLAVNSQSA